MQVSPFGYDVRHSVDEPPEEREKRRAEARPAPPGDEDEKRREDTPEEPGYGHGV